MYLINEYMLLPFEIILRTPFYWCKYSLNCTIFPCYFLHVVVFFLLTSNTLKFNFLEEIIHYRQQFPKQKFMIWSYNLIFIWLIFSLLIYIIISKIPFFLTLYHSLSISLFLLYPLFRTLVHLLGNVVHLGITQKEGNVRNGRFYRRRTLRRKWNNLLNHKEQFTFHSVEKNLSSAVHAFDYSMEYLNNTVLNTWSYEIQMVMKKSKVFLVRTFASNY